MQFRLCGRGQMRLCVRVRGALPLRRRTGGKSAGYRSALLSCEMGVIGFEFGDGRRMAATKWAPSSWRRD